MPARPSSLFTTALARSSGDTRAGAIPVAGNFDRDLSNGDEIGLYYAVHPKHRRQGYASEAARALVDFAFEVAFREEFLDPQRVDYTAEELTVRFRQRATLWRDLVTEGVAAPTPMLRLHLRSIGSIEAVKQVF